MFRFIMPDPQLGIRGQTDDNFQSDRNLNSVSCIRTFKNASQNIRVYAAPSSRTGWS